MELSIVQQQENYQHFFTFSFSGDMRAPINFSKKDFIFQKLSTQSLSLCIGFCIIAFKKRNLQFIEKLKGLLRNEHSRITRQFHFGLPKLEQSRSPSTPCFSHSQFIQFLSIQDLKQNSDIYEVILFASELRKQISRNSLSNSFYCVSVHFPDFKQQFHYTLYLPIKPRQKRSIYFQRPQTKALPPPLSQYSSQKAKTGSKPHLTLNAFYVRNPLYRILSQDEFLTQILSLPDLFDSVQQITEIAISQDKVLSISIYHSLQLNFAENHPRTQNILLLSFKLTNILQLSLNRWPSCPSLPQLQRWLQLELHDKVLKIVQIFFVFIEDGKCCSGTPLPSSSGDFELFEGVTKQSFRFNAHFKYFTLNQSFQQLLALFLTLQSSLVQIVQATHSPHQQYAQQEKSTFPALVLVLSSITQSLIKLIDRFKLQSDELNPTTSIRTLYFLAQPLVSLPV
ncbi:hypothetical protein ABPG74_008401 [Tetrahymena malaccensis]